MNRVRSTRPGESVRKAASDWIARRDAGLSAAAESEFQTWREASPRHAEALARYEKLWSHLDRPRVAGVSPELNRDLALLQQRDRRRRVRWAGTASLLVVTVVMLGAAWWSFDQNTDVPAARPSPIAILIPERRVLTDGTVIEYPAGSAFTVDFSSTGFRRVTLARGEAHFQIARNSARPFVVRAAGVDIEAVGTAFSVQLAKAAVEVLVTAGRVAVDQSISRITPQLDSGATTPARPTLVAASQKLSVTLESAPNSPPSQVESLSPAEVDQRLAWRNPRMEFSGTSLNEVVAAINRYGAERGGVQFTIGDPALKSTRLSGIFRVDDARAFLGILEKGFGIEAERLGEQTIILRKRR